MVDFSEYFTEVVTVTFSFLSLTVTFTAFFAGVFTAVSGFA